MFFDQIYIAVGIALALWIVRSSDVGMAAGIRDLITWAYFLAPVVYPHGIHNPRLLVGITFVASSFALAYFRKRQPLLGGLAIIWTMSWGIYAALQVNGPSGPPWVFVALGLSSIVLWAIQVYVKNRETSS